MSDMENGLLWEDTLIYIGATTSVTGCMLQPPNTITLVGFEAFCIQAVQRRPYNLRFLGSEDQRKGVFNVDTTILGTDVLGTMGIVVTLYNCVLGREKSAYI